MKETKLSPRLMQKNEALRIEEELWEERKKHVALRVQKDLSDARRENAALKQKLASSKQLLRTMIDSNSDLATSVSPGATNEEDQKKKRVKALSSPAMLSQPCSGFEGETKGLILSDSRARDLKRMEEARAAVKTIKARHLSERIQRDNNPPPFVQVTLKAVTRILGHSKCDSWKDVQQILRQPRFLQRMVDFSPRDAPIAVMQLVQDDLNACGPALNIKSVRSQNEIAGVMLKWVKSAVAVALERGG